jgi:Flp pilus assembly protein TadB
MGAFELFVIRLILSGMIAFLITRFFFQNTPVIMVFALAIAMLGLAYLLERLRKRDKRG